MLAKGHLQDGQEAASKGAAAEERQERVAGGCGAVDAWATGWGEGGGWREAPQGGGG